METSDVSATWDVAHKYKNFQKIPRFYIYVLFSLKDKGLYIGFTSDLKKRLTEHAKGRVISTRIRRPFLLIHYEYFINGTDARARERFLKSGFGRKQLKESLKRTLLGKEIVVRT